MGGRLGVTIVAAWLGGAAAAAPQDVSSLPLEGTPRIDGLYVAPDGRMFGAGTYTGSEVYRIDADGTVTVIAEGLRGPTHLGMDAEGNLYVSEFNGSAIARVAQDGTVDRFDVPPGPAGVVVDPDGTVYTAHYGTGSGTERRVTKITPDGTVSTLAADGFLASPIGLARDQDYLYAANFYDGRVVRIAPDGTQSLVATLTGPQGNPLGIGHLAYADGALWATTGRSARIVRIDLDGTVEVWAGDGTPEDRDGPRASARFRMPNGIAASPDGAVLWIATAGNGPGDRSKLRRILLRAPDRAQAATWKDVQLSDIETMRDKFVALAEAFDASQYGWRPMEKVRSVHEVLALTVAEANLFPGLWGIPAPAGAAQTYGPEIERVLAMDKPATVAALRMSFEHLVGAVRRMDEDKRMSESSYYGRSMPTHANVATAMADMHEHLGQLIAYARTNHVVPPWSRSGP